MDVALFLHVLGAMVMVGALLLAAMSLVGAWRAEDAAAMHLGYRALLWGALPAWLVMRVFGQVTMSAGDYDEDQAWIGVGFGTSELGFVLLVIATVLSGMSVRRAAGGGRIRAAAVLVGIVIALSLIAIWAMTTKPT